MKISIQAMIVAVLVVALALVLFLDPRTDLYKSDYNKQATQIEVAQWIEDFKDWKNAPTWDRFNMQDGHKHTPDPLGPPDFEATYIFGKYNYVIKLQIRGNHLLYASWGNDDQSGGGAWTAVGEGYHMHGRKWRTTWSCLDLSRAVSNGGGAWFTFNSDRSTMFVKYYHDTIPFSTGAIEEGEAVRVKDDWDSAVDIWEGELLEGRYRPTVLPIKRKAELWGRVIDEEGEGIAGATVRLRKPYAKKYELNGNPRHDKRINGDILDVTTLSDSRGFFKVTLAEIRSLTIVSAGKHKFFNGYVAFDQQMTLASVGKFSQKKVALATITLRRVPQIDHPEYEYTSPVYLDRSKYEAKDHMNCGNCHRTYLNEWKQSRHATMATNEWTKAAFLDYREHALANGQTEDECTPCHSPSLASKLDSFNLTGKTLLDASGVHNYGNHCDFCHKIDRVSDLQAPGVNGSLHLLRPDPRDETFPGPVKQIFGNAPDAWFLYMGAAYNPLYEMGTLCASCHEHTSNDGRHSQGTYSEWKASKYAKPGKDYRECQSCHMPGHDKSMKMQTMGPPPIFAESRKSKFASAGFRGRESHESHHHEFFGTDAPSGKSLDFLKSGVSMAVDSKRTGNDLSIRVTLKNVGAGHAIPTGHGLKRYLLLIIAKDATGNPIKTTNALPSAEVFGMAESASTGAVIGRRFGAEWRTPFWKPGVELDNRLLPDQPRNFSFLIEGAAKVEVKLVLRRGSPKMVGDQLVKGKVANAPLDVMVHNWKSR